MIHGFIRNLPISNNFFNKNAPTITPMVKESPHIYTSESWSGTEGVGRSLPIKHGYKYEYGDASNFWKTIT